ncbi:site-specific integrase [Gordonia sp. HY285]|uniref:tyrosine-type recombinase/integrase n=1 Tax=Gordonia liuliyuniae TaxID=2911517 RepID=UPI001F21B973|nr:site-specific integrase [Gordonia liuliyuniae]MCF8609993.1 site-specific integrase [Gordonia liuliyuniae]
MSGKERAERADDSIRKQPNGRWLARPTLGIDPVTGKQVRPAKRFDRKQEARDWVHAERQKWAEKSWAARSERTFSDAADHWLTVRDADDSTRANTVRADRESLAYARRSFGDVPLQRITPELLVDWTLTMSTKPRHTKDGKPIPTRPLAPATKRRAIVSTQSVFVHCKRMRWISHDPSEFLDVPAQKVVVALDDDDVWTPTEMDGFLSRVAGDRLGGCYALTLLGLRREEVGGLQWGDFDLTAATLQIERARVDVNGHDVTDDPKNPRSARSLPIPARELAIVKAMRRTHQKERLALGQAFAETDFLVCREDGTPMPVRTYSNQFQQITKELGLRPITLRNLRHSSVSRMREAGVPADVVAAWHGHSERMTQAIYGRVTDERLSAAADVLSKAVGTS